MLDQQCNQIRNKLNQELQQAKNDFNALQAEFDKVGFLILKSSIRSVFSCLSSTALI